VDSGERLDSEDSGLGNRLAAGRLERADADDAGDVEI
jgi:hypothetical protein